MGGGELYCDVCGLAPVVPAVGPAGSARGRAAGAAPLHSPPTGITAAPGGAAPGGSGRGGSSSRSSGHGSRGSGPGSARSGSSRSSRRSVSGRLPRSLSGRVTSPSVSVRSSSSGTSTSGRSRLGAGLVSVPAVPRPDPRTAVLADPEVPERKRFCSRGECGAPVGRARGGRPGRTEGFCTKCGHPYSFVPKLHPGDVVRGQYEVAGCLAHGGLGWVYLAIDRAVADRWVVLKGLLDTGDEDALAAAVSERRFLAEIEHSNIVRIYNFVEHLDQRTGSLDGYIVMEYVGGKSLKEIANERRTPDGRRDPLPVEQACAYGIEALEALAHLHSRNLLYCDFKVDNAIQQQDQLKLIDMGAVRRMDDEDSPIYGTVGYQAPEVAEAGPSVASDLYTVARTLAVLTFDFQGYTNVFADSLPDPENIEVFRTYESFYRLLVRATDPDPDRRFASAEEMADQLTGVLREVVALQSGRPRPALSTLFGPELRVVDTELFAEWDADPSALGGRARRRRARRATAPAAAAPSTTPAAGGPSVGAAAPDPVRPLDARAAALALPVPRIDPGDPNAGFLAGLAASAPAELDAVLRTAPVDSPELRFLLLRAQLESGDGPGATATLASLRAGHAEDWRTVWHRGLHALATGDHATAAVSFDAVYDAFPGETAPKLALGVCAEILGQLDNAEEYYRLVWTTDPSYVSAAFGLARVRLRTGDRTAAVRALESVPESSIHYTAARVAAVRARLRRGGPALGADTGDGAVPGAGTGVGAGTEAGAGAGGGVPAGRAIPALDDLLAAAGQVERLREFGLDAPRRERLSTEVLGSALDWVLSGGDGAPRNPAAGGPHPDGAPPGPVLLGCSLDERGLRLGLERSYRTLARLAQRGEERIELVERANRFRPRTWV
ncbi:tetratricopeptide repeat protein [Streptomyces pactum]|uniref:non-specific serine/threonine protein kinase n=1 Tax=Streptomyces pactum TaxID=68249 RepID=A0ABS0NIF8_9ACTN|nr:serine/threonine-protein kinase [Streptomyces pactum]MBH5334879.1 tetratricopeptide repeat protein [Streptomyces pactum]